jgi:hypothetical protein
MLPTFLVQQTLYKILLILWIPSSKLSLLMDPNKRTETEVPFFIKPVYKFITKTVMACSSDSTTTLWKTFLFLWAKSAWLMDL